MSTLAELTQDYVQRYLYHRGLPLAVVDNLPSELLSILDHVNDRATREVFKVRDLVDVERCSPEALKFILLQYGLPVPTFIDDLHLRRAARVGAYVNKYRNTVVGWQTYLSALNTTPVDLKVACPHKLPDIFTLNRLGFQFANAAQLSQAGSDADPVSYLINDLVATRSIVVNLTSTDITNDFEQFVRDTVAYFVPMAVPTPDNVPEIVQLGGWGNNWGNNWSGYVPPDQPAHPVTITFVFKNV